MQLVSSAFFYISFIYIFLLLIIQFLYLFSLGLLFASHVITLSHTVDGLEMIETLSSNPLYRSAFRATFSSMDAMNAALRVYASAKFTRGDSFVAFTYHRQSGKGM